MIFEVGYQRIRNAEFIYEQNIYEMKKFVNREIAKWQWY